MNGKAYSLVEFESQRIKAVQSPVIPIVADLISRHPGTISLGQGVVHYPPPPQVQNHLAAFFADPENHKYKPVAGTPALLEALRNKLAEENCLSLEGTDVLVTAGGNMAFQNAILAIADPGDEIILQRPYYFNHEMAITLANCRTVVVDTDVEYQLRVDAIADAITPRTRAVVTVSPNNPTGAVYPASSLAAVNALCRERGLYHIHDEAYEYFTYEGATHVSPGSFANSEGHTISLYSLSKSYGFASWRIGYMAYPARLTPAIRKIQDTVLICPPVISQYAALGALEAGAAYCRTQIASIAHVRPLVQAELAHLPACCTVPPAQGAFYFFLRIQTPMESMTLVERLVQEFGVAVIPGTTFGAQGCTLRISYGALQETTVKEGIGRLVVGLNALLT